MSHSHYMSKFILKLIFQTAKKLSFINKKNSFFPFGVFENLTRWACGGTPIYNLLAPAPRDCNSENPVSLILKIFSKIITPHKHHTSMELRSHENDP